MAVIKYLYALDEHNNVVCIDDVVREERHLHTFHCIGCGSEMIARMGKERAKHFAHKGDGEGCGVETYLHVLAKRLIKEKFDKEESFEMAIIVIIHVHILAVVNSLKIMNAENEPLT